MTLARLIYCSTVNGIGNKDIEAILEKSIVNNTLDNITGSLIYDGKHFLQCLEGGRKSVTARYKVILQDSRHKDVELIDFSPIKMRHFAHWAMAYAGSSAIDSKTLSTYTADGFNPREMMFPDAIIDMMWRLSQ